MAGGSKKPALKKLRGRVNRDQEKSEVTNNAYMGVWCFSIRTTIQDARCFEMLVCNSHTGDSVACVSVKKSAKQTNAGSVDSEPPMASGRYYAKR